MQHHISQQQKKGQAYFFLIFLAVFSMLLMVVIDTLPFNIPHARYLSVIKEFERDIDEYKQFIAIEDTVIIYSHPKSSAVIWAKCNEYMRIYKIGEQRTFYQVKVYFWMKTRYLNFFENNAILSKKADKMRIGWSGSLKLGFAFRNAEFKVIEFDEQRSWMFGELTGWVKKESVKTKIL